jgi:hypothetical protein
VIGFFRRLIQRYGFFKREPKRSMCNAWEQHPFYTDAGQKARRLAQIARERDALKERLAKAIRDKKARAPIYAKLRALSVEELRVEAGK